MWKSPTAKATGGLLAALLGLPGAAAFGQNPAIDPQIKEIDEQVRAIGRDTLRRAPCGPAAAIDTVRRPRQLLFSGRYTAYYTQAGELQQLLVRQPASFSSATTRYYFVQHEVVYVDTHYANASRMGSCGRIAFHNRYYLGQGQLLAAQLSEPPTGPYRDCYPVVPAQELARLLEELPPALARLPACPPAR